MAAKKSTVPKKPTVKKLHAVPSIPDRPAPKQGTPPPPPKGPK